MPGPRRSVQSLSESRPGAAAEPVGEQVVVWRAADRLGVGTEAATPAAEAGPARVRGPRAVSSPTGALSGLPVGVTSRETGLCTTRWWRSPIRESIPTAAPGTGHMPRRSPTKPSLKSSSARPAERRPAGARPWRPRSSSARRCRRSRRGTRAAGRDRGWPAGRPADRPAGGTASRCPFHPLRSRGVALPGVPHRLRRRRPVLPGGTPPRSCPGGGPHPLCQGQRGCATSPSTNLPTTPSGSRWWPSPRISSPGPRACASRASLPPPSPRACGSWSCTWPGAGAGRRRHDPSPGGGLALGTGAGPGLRHAAWPVLRHLMPPS
jgi:hypothetical protein